MKRSRTNLTFAIALTIVLFTLPLRASASTFVPDKIQYPGSTATVARGINNSGDVAGNYVCPAAGCINPDTGVRTNGPGSHGFLLHDGVFTSIDVPASTIPACPSTGPCTVTSTLARGISEQGVVVGQYDVSFPMAAGTPGCSRTGTCTVTHGFAYFDSNYVSIDVPAQLFDHPSALLPNTLVIRMSPQGDLVGCFHEDSQTMTTMHGWRFRNGTFTELVTGDNNAHDPDTMNNGIAPTGEIVGIYLSSGVSYIADENGIMTTFTFPDGQNGPGLFTLAWDVNAKGDIVGVYGTNPTNTIGGPVAPSGFLLTKHGDYVDLKVQGASATQVFGINSLRQIVGAYTDSTGTHGFMYRLGEGNQ